MNSLKNNSCFNWLKCAKNRLLTIKLIINFCKSFYDVQKFYCQTLIYKNLDNSLSRSGNPGPIEYIIDCTLGYPKGKVADMGQIMLGEWPDEDSTVAVHYRVYEAKPEFADEPTLRKWLYERYEEKDKLLAKFYETGKFPGEGRPVHFSLAKNLMVQVFWIALFYFHYNFWIRPLAGAALRYLLALF